MEKNYKLIVITLLISYSLSYAMEVKIEFDPNCTAIELFNGLTTPFKWPKKNENRKQTRTCTLSELVRDNKITIKPHTFDTNKKILLLNRMQIGTIGYTAFKKIAKKHPDIMDIFFTGNQIKQIPTSISEFADLRRLFISENLLTTIPLNIGRLDKLYILNIGYNNISKLPKSMSRLTNLGSLTICNNRLTRISKVIYELPNLLYLDLDNNMITEVSDSIGKCGFTTLKLRNNNITRLPDSMRNLIYLAILNLDGNRLSQKEQDRTRTLLTSPTHHITLDNQQT